VSRLCALQPLTDYPAIQRTLAGDEQPSGRSTRRRSDGLRVSRPRRETAVRIFAVLFLLTTAMPALAQPAFVELVRGSGLIFQGTVRAIGQATPGIVTQPNTAVVTVDRVLEALPPIGSPRGELTVRLRNPVRMRPGQAAIFFTYVYSAGATLGLEEVGTLPLEAPAVVERRISEARQVLADEALGKRLSSARMVVTGEVGEPSPESATRQPVSEHDPLWPRFERLHP
jgi:hypothetical protein